ncbi:MULTISPECIES: peroxiredoxin [Streptomyces]|uniref:Alkyl hydroperoxide reductase/ Thiol specific antioxidant/ Mal allergen n=1 Tax=Streptomyces zinciresistens K42 TaxID=700597 RepID=G2G5U9_9ACTN|nr:MULTISPECIES: peroxiredoxin family protein [Streptomyces]EGX61038.1 alkyl hydroperoxide reductase/ Thiol specific antioxidant/ Mal allergen [Streptomyces zinciresistens K42]MDT9696564.1 peroxiredoxin family protein [Streptomyces sp. P17]
MGADTKPGTKAARHARLAAERESERQRQHRRRRLRNSAVITAILIAVVAGLYAVFNKSEQPSATGYEVGSPGIGQTAPGFSLASSGGGNASLAALKGKTVLLYFQEGLTCQPCWDQIRDLEKSSAKVKDAGIDQIVSVTTDPANLVARKVKDEALKTPVLSDPDLKVSKAYQTNEYGMMGTSRNGHSFVLVGPDGTIQWRADYGGAPKYTMYVKVDKILADLEAGRQA